MRIIGGKDYYDSGMAWGMDPTIVFLRNGDRRMTSAEVHEGLGIERRRPGFHFLSAEDRSDDPVRLGVARNQNAEFRGSDGHYSMRAAHVVLCGVLRSGLIVHRSFPFTWPSRASENHWIWSAESFRVFATKHGLGVSEGSDERVRDTDYDRSHGMVMIDYEMLGLESWFAPKELVGRAKERILDERITILSYDPEAVKYEHKDRLWAVDQDTLGDMGFAKAIDPVTAFQEISMWKGGVLGSDGPGIVEITDDKVKIEKHGFHHPTSFRRAKAEKR